MIQPLRLTIYHQIPEDNHFASLWNHLVSRVEHPEIFYTYEWSLAVARAYSSLHPLLLAAEEEDSIIGIVALAIDDSQKTAFFLCGTTADYCDFVSLSDRRLDFVIAVLQQLQIMGIRNLLLANLPADSLTFNVLEQAAQATGYFFFRRPAYFCSQVVFSSSEKREFVTASLRRKQMVRRHMKGMAKIAPVTLRHLKSKEAILSALPEYTVSHIARFLAMGKISNLAVEERRNFLNHLVSLFAGRPWANLSALMLGERPVAWNFGFQFAGSWFWYQPTFDMEFFHYYPGFCLLAKIVEEGCNSPEIKMIDLGLGDETYKERFANNNRPTEQVTISNSLIHLFKEKLRYRVSKIVKRIPALELLLRRLIQLLASARDRLARKGKLNFLLWLYQRMITTLWSHSEVVFFSFDFVPGGHSCTDSTIQPIDLKLLANSVLHYASDTSTLTYLLRCAKRLVSKEAKGFALLNSEGQPLHFCWVSNFANFHVAELDITLKEQAPKAVLLYDCWTPSLERGHGYYAATISQVASALGAEQEIWIYTVRTNSSSLKGIEKAGFRQRFHIIRDRVFFVNMRRQSRDLISSA